MIGNDPTLSVYQNLSAGPLVVLTIILLGMEVVTAMGLRPEPAFIYWAFGLTLFSLARSSRPAIVLSFVITELGQIQHKLPPRHCDAHQLFVKEEVVV